MNLIQNYFLKRIKNLFLGGFFFFSFLQRWLENLEAIVATELGISSVMKVPSFPALTHPYSAASGGAVCLWDLGFMSLVDDKRAMLPWPLAAPPGHPTW